MWQAIAKEIIEKDMQDCTDILQQQPEYLRFWEYIRIQPEKWSEPTMGEEGGGFWVVAIIGKNVVYYNNIEEGYNYSPYTSYGVIDEYTCSEQDLHHLVRELYNNIHKEDRSSSGEKGI